MLRKSTFGKRKPESGNAPTHPIRQDCSGALKNRAKERRSVWCPCTVTSEMSEPGQQPLVCEGIVLDVSDAGARIRFRSRSQLPKDIMIKASRIGVRKKGHVIWQNEFDAGITLFD